MCYNISMKKEKYCVYKHTAPNGKVYIGITQQRPEARWQRDGLGYKTAGWFRFAIAKYGWENFTHTILASGLSFEDACIAERKLIKRYDSRNPAHGYNVQPGGASSRGCLLSDEAREKIRQSKLGDRNPMFGRVLTEEHRRRIAEANTGVPKSPETRLRMRRAQSNRSAATRQKLSDAQNKTPVRCIETGVVYPGVSIAARETGTSCSNITACCKGRRKSTGGFHWEYAS